MWMTKITSKLLKYITLNTKEIFAMPWINQEMCTGCGICAKRCPADAVTMSNRQAEINDDECIRCGICHDVCPRDAVRHDGEHIPIEIESNLKWVRQLQKHPYYLNNPERQQQLLERLKRFFSKQRKVADETINKLQEPAVYSP